MNINIKGKHTIEPGEILRVDDPRLKRLGFAVQHCGSTPSPGHRVRVEWYFNDQRVSPFDFPRRDISYTAPHAYNNRIGGPGQFAVKLLIDGLEEDVVSFEIVE